MDYGLHTRELDKTELREWLRTHRITQREAAQWAGISERSLRRALQGKGNVPGAMLRGSMRQLMARAITDWL